MDAYKHREHFSHLAKEKIDYEFLKGFIYGNDHASIDFLFTGVKLVVSRFTDNPDILYMIVTALYGYIISLNVVTLKRLHRGISSTWSHLFLLLFFFVVGLYEVNSFRFWMAGHLLFYGILKVFSAKDNSGWLIIIITPFVHFSFFMMIPLILLTWCWGGKKSLLIFTFLLFMVSHFVSSPNSTFISSFLPDTNIDSFEDRKLSYLGINSNNSSEEVSNIISDNAPNSLNWYVRGRVILLKWTVLLYVTIAIAKWKNGGKFNGVIIILAFGMLLSGVSLFFIDAVPQIGRFYRVGLLFIIGSMYIFYSKPMVAFDRLLIGVKPVIYTATSLFTIVELRIAFDSITIDTLVSNPLIAVLYKSNVNVIETVKYFMVPI